MHLWMFKNWLRENCVWGGRRLRAPLYSSARNLSALQNCLQHGIVWLYRLTGRFSGTTPRQGGQYASSLASGLQHPWMLHETAVAWIRRRKTVTQTRKPWTETPLVAKALWSRGCQERPRHDKMGPFQMSSWDIPLPDSGRGESSLTFEGDPFGGALSV